jgi:hypothetical protein
MADSDAKGSRAMVTGSITVAGEAKKAFIGAKA